VRRKPLNPLSPIEQPHRRRKLRWSGTFHGVGARLLREYATRIGLDPAFTIHDREDSPI
jgi:superfamily I DNA/RNA helicase